MQAASRALRAGIAEKLRQKPAAAGLDDDALYALLFGDGDQ
jgi:hypothetical protein